MPKPTTKDERCPECDTTPYDGSCTECGHEEDIIDASMRYRRDHPEEDKPSQKGMEERFMEKFADDFGYFGWKEGYYPHDVIDFINQELKNQRESLDFWKDIVSKDGELDREQLQKELLDYHYILKQLPEIYCHITGGLLSKQMYSAKTIIASSDDYTNKLIDEALKDQREEIASVIADDS